MSRLRRPLVAVMAAVLALPVVMAGYYGVFVPAGFTVAASSPDSAAGMTLAVAIPNAPLKNLDGDASYQIRYNGKLVYPPGGKGATFPIKEGRGSAFIPYSIFVVGNGLYEVTVMFDGGVERISVGVQKWVNHVFIVPSEKQGRIVVDLLLTRTSGGGPSDRVLAAGDLFIDVRYRGVDGSLNVQQQRLKYSLSGDEPLVRIPIPRTAFQQGPGYYSFEATFHNDQAFGNNGVKNDPSLGATNPPRNWIWYGGS